MPAAAMSEPIAHPKSGWSLVQTNGHSERLANFHLRRQGFEVYLPMRAVAKKTAEHASPFFPRYLFVWIDGANPRWEEVRTTIGVQALVRLGAGLGRVPDQLVERLKAREVFGLITLSEKKAPPPEEFEDGARLVVEKGKLFGFEVVFERATSDARRVLVLLDFFGRESRVVLPRNQLRKLDA